MKRRNSDSSCATIIEQSQSTNGNHNFMGMSGTNRLGRCEVCAANDARYSCPKCEVKTCCVRCVQIHKKELSCDGIRDRTKFIALRDMTKMDFMSDYYFLEECTRYVEDRKSDNIKRFTRYNKILPRHLFRLRNVAAQRSTTLRFLLQNFTRNKENTTHYDPKLLKIFWRIEWIFVNAGNLKYVDELCDETIPLHQLLDKYVNAESPEKVLQKKQLEYYQSIGTFGLKVLLKAEGVKHSSSRFYALDVTQTLKKCLAGKTIVEFPIIYVSYDTNPNSFDIIDSDEDVKGEAKSYEDSLKELHRKLRTQKPATDNTDETTSKSSKKVQTERKRKEKQAKRDELEKSQSNYLFSDERLLDIYSSSENETSDDTEEEDGGQS